ncbi:winged helix-turn-helix domain-containing protein [Bacteroidota bacterium]
MENPIKGLNKHFESRVRLGVMSILAVNEWVDFNTLKDLLEITDGNLASHIKALESHQYIEVRKQFIAKKPRTTYNLTNTGRIAFQNHISALESLLNK